MMSWRVGQYISEKLKTNEWGAKVVMQLSEYLRTQGPDLKGYSRRNIYNMVSFYEAYSSLEFISTQQRYGFDEIVQFQTAQLPVAQIPVAAIVQFQTAQLPKVLTLTTFTNHLTILTNIKNLLDKSYQFLIPK